MNLVQEFINLLKFPYVLKKEDEATYHFFNENGDYFLYKKDSKLFTMGLIFLINNSRKTSYTGNNFKRLWCYNKSYILKKYLFFS